jgi:hypothetical protein
MGAIINSKLENRMRNCVLEILLNLYVKQKDWKKKGGGGVKREKREKRESETYAEVTRSEPTEFLNSHLCILDFGHKLLIRQTSTGVM